MREKRQIRTGILEPCQDNQRRRQAATSQVTEDQPVDIAVFVVPPRRTGLCDRGEQKIGANSNSRRNPETGYQLGVVNDPPPTPVIPTRIPTRNPPRVMRSQISGSCVSIRYTASPRGKRAPLLGLVSTGWQPQASAISPGDGKRPEQGSARPNALPAKDLATLALSGI